MNSDNNISLKKIGVFYDGNYFLHVSNYYNYFHPRKSRISISGLHEFIRNEVATEENIDVRLCQIVDAHYFRGRLSAQEASQKGNMLYYDRVFDDILMSEGVVTHYLPVRIKQEVKMEKGIDVWLALECFELAFYKNFDVIVLITSDGDYVPLIRKLNTLGMRVMVLSWDFEYMNDEGQKMITRTSQDLLEEVSYPISMHEIIDNRIRKNDPLINNLFVKNDKNIITSPTPAVVPEGEKLKSNILSLKSGFGFIKWPNNNVFFHYTSLVDTDFNELKEGDTVEFEIELNKKGEQIAKNVKRIIDDSIGNRLENYSSEFEHNPFAD
ncbi:NYN domain-containing protein [Ignavibacteria bacterium CHB1]|jgi:Cold shock proteins|nr:MAG: NYN domain-containing protein [Chlorobiota bacterium]KXK04874.1 MAG: NYN domain protein [Chlorobi bacterium OLB4]MBV6397691.1 hypothetical protein [Ignavibacteria bacterium]MCC6885471.1 NYN domain-containing protein [Ignavibacteriales bacterium]MCE7952823.1 NYN domain-containing protein [Chlorobi bacterium CHB7]MDL1887010.1 NYN domain-containing protein [Ignavibacteria bacterium CHB1]OQY79058.1 MAG: cold-shock protein [Ignavibacteriales bacterium UTCHB1]RIK49585.1 MAG: cold-shock pro